MMTRQHTRPTALLAILAFIVFHTVTIAALFNALSSPHDTPIAYAAAEIPTGTADNFFWSEAKHTPTHDRKPVITPAVCNEPIASPKIEPLFCYFPDSPVMLTSPESTPSSQRDPPSTPS